MNYAESGIQCRIKKIWKKQIFGERLEQRNQFVESRIQEFEQKLFSEIDIKI